MNWIKYICFRDICALFQALLVLPAALIAKLFIRHFWLICEERDEARDNGYWLFRYLREQVPEQKVAYAINKRSVDYPKVQRLGKVISYGTWQHWFWYLVAEKNISSQKGGKPNAAVCYLFEVKIPIWRNKRYFLQHGVIINDLAWLYYKNCRFRLFVCSGKEEFRTVRENYGYPQGVVQCLGLARFDQLHDFTIDSNLILVMPTWREWIVRDLPESEFQQTAYFRAWNEFLQSRELERILMQYGKKVLFFPHRNMQRYLKYFHHVSQRIELADWERYEIQDVLKRSALMITDFSSVFFDFAYMKKPVIFYQFDEEEFRQRQYATGYFDYHENLLGKWSGNLNDCLQLLEQACQEGLEKKNEVAESFFGWYDRENCRRNYEAIFNR